MVRLCHIPTISTPYFKARSVTSVEQVMRDVIAPEIARNQAHSAISRAPPPITFVTSEKIAIFSEVTKVIAPEIAKQL